MNDDKTKQALEQELAAYKRLESIGMTQEFQEYADLLIKTVSGKMVMAFTTDSIKNIEDFYKVKGEVVARLQPLQTVHESGALARNIETQLKEYYLDNS